MTYRIDHGVVDIQSLKLLSDVIMFGICIYTYVWRREKKKKRCFLFLSLSC